MSGSSGSAGRTAVNRNFVLTPRGVNVLRNSPGGRRIAARQAATRTAARASRGTAGGRRSRVPLLPSSARSGLNSTGVGSRARTTRGGRRAAR